MYAVKRLLNSLKQLVILDVQWVHRRFMRWTKPSRSSLTLGVAADLFRSKPQLVAENALLRQQLIILKRQVKRPACTKADRIALVLLARVVRAWKQALFIIQPETLLRWHREGFRRFWKRKSQATSQKPKVAAETVALIKEMATKNRLWGAERIRGELLKLGIHVCKRTIQKYMRCVRVLNPRGQKWGTFLRNHASQIWACDALSGDRTLLSFALCFFHHRAQVTTGDPCRSDMIPHRRLGSATASGSDSLRASTNIFDLRSREQVRLLLCSCGSNEQHRTPQNALSCATSGCNM